jgi:hypothetical protein
MREAQVGDLCVPQNAISGAGQRGHILVCDKDLLDVLFKVDVDSFLVVTSVEQPTQISTMSIRSICKSIRKQTGVQDTGRHKVHQVLIASGQHAGMVGYVPSFWLQVEVPAQAR